MTEEKKRFGSRLGSVTPIRAGIGASGKNAEELKKASEKLALEQAQEAGSDQELEDEPIALGGFRPANEVLDGPTEVATDEPSRKENLGTAPTAVMPKSDPPKPPSVIVPPPAPAVVPVSGTVDPAQSVELSASMQVEAIVAVDQDKVVTTDAPVVDPAALQTPRDFSTGEESFFASEPKDDSESGSSAPASEPPPPASVPAPAAPVAAAPAAPRPDHKRVAMPPATPARLFWVNHRSQILLACIPLLAVFAGCLSLSWFVGYRQGLRDRDTAPAVSTGSETIPSEPDALALHVGLEEPRPARAVMPPEDSDEPRDPGFSVSGQPSGSHVIVSARQAFPQACATAGSDPIDGAMFHCGRGERRGDNYCDCDVAGYVP